MTLCLESHFLSHSACGEWVGLKLSYQKYYQNDRHVLVMIVLTAGQPVYSYFAPWS